VNNEDIKKLAQAIEEYAKWVKDTSKTMSYPQTLMDFLVFAINNGMAWKDMFTVDTLKAFRNYSEVIYVLLPLLVLLIVVRIIRFKSYRRLFTNRC